MTGVVPERRRAPRAAVQPGCWLTMVSTSSVQLLDLSAGGVAFVCPVRLEQGRTASIATSLGGQAFSCQLQVCWCRHAPVVSSRYPQFETGAAFLPLEESSRRVLQSFLKLSPRERE